MLEPVTSERWQSLSPILYDWVATAARTWPSLACRWGASTHGRVRQRLYYSEQTDGTAPNTLVAAFVDVPRARTTTAESVAAAWDRQTGSSSAFRKGKVIHHPGEVNKIRELHGAKCECVLTHSDVAEVYLWNVSTQLDRSESHSRAASVPDALLVGHSAPARFALATTAQGCCVASGGEDAAVCLWRLADFASSLEGAPAELGRPSLNSGGLGGLGGGSMAASPRLQCSVRFQGHSATVEDVSFSPASNDLLCSVGDDAALIFWDARGGAVPAARLAGAHGRADIHCCDWSPHDEHLVLTGGADETVRVFDRRKAGAGEASHALLHVLKGHSEAVNAVAWCPDARGVLASAASDGLVCLWDISRIEASDAPAAKGAPPPGLIFQHPGHRGSPVLDVHWNVACPWTLCSVSENADAGGSLVQCWRISDLLYRPESEVLEELEPLREQLLAAASDDD